MMKLKHLFLIGIMSLFVLLPVRAEAKDIMVPGNYPTISAAVSAAADGDTICLLPGVYRESVNMVGKTLNLIGTDRDACVLEFPATDYHHPPLQMSSGNLKNLTIHAFLGGAAARYYGAYCLHADYDHMEGRSIVAENVRFVNESYEAVGVGLRPRCTVAFYGCVFESAADEGALFVHKYDTTRTDPADQNLILDRCVLSNSSFTVPTLILQAQGLGRPVAKALLTNNVITNLRGGPGFLMRYYFLCGTFNPPGLPVVVPASDWYLDPVSGGNNIAALNAG